MALWEDGLENSGDPRREKITTSDAGRVGSWHRVGRSTLHDRRSTLNEMWSRDHVTLITRAPYKRLGRTIKTIISRAGGLDCFLFLSPPQALLREHGPRHVYHLPLRNRDSGNCR